MTVRSRARISGFTLLEVIVALVLTGLVVTVAYAAARAGVDARSRVAAQLRQVQRVRAARVIVRDALRNARAAQGSDDPRGGFTLADNTLSFVSAGGVAPLDPDYDWHITIGPSQGRVILSATAMGRAGDDASLSFALPDATRWSVWLLAPDGQTWQSEWADPSIMPRAVAIGFWNGQHLSGLPLHLVLWPGTGPIASDSLPAIGSLPLAGLP